MYNFKLIYDNQSLLVKTDPIGHDEMSYMIRRSKKDGHGTFKNFNLDLKWIKDGAQFIRDIYELEGIEAVVQVEVYLFDPNNSVNELILSGKLNLTKYAINTDRGRLEVSAPIEDDNFQIRFLNSRDTDINLTSDKDIDGFTISPAEVITTKLHSKSIAEEYEANMSTDTEIDFLSQTNIGRAKVPEDDSENVVNEFWVPLFMDKVEKESLKRPFTLQYGTVTSLNDVSNFFQFEFNTKANIIANIPQKLDLKFWSSKPNGRVDCSAEKNMFQDLVFEFYFEWRDKDNVTKQKTLIGVKSADLCGQGTKVDETIGGELITTDNYTANMNIGDGSSLFDFPETEFLVGDKIYFYAYVKHTGDYHRLLGSYDIFQEFKVTIPEHSQTYINITGVSIFEETDSEGIMIHEAFEQVVKGITGEVGIFKSDYFGRTDLGYAEDGPGALRMVSKGKNIRGYPIGKPITVSGEEITDNLFISFKALMDDGQVGIDAISFGFEELDGNTIIRVEPIEHFYETDISLTLEKVSKLNKRVISDKYVNNINLGYQKWTGQKDIGTLFEINSEHKYYTGLKQIDKSEDHRTKLVTGSYSIESTRRLSVNLSTKDGQYDDDIFLIQVLRNSDPTGTDYLSESDESIESISGVQDSKGIYNIRLTPARILLNWGRVLAPNFYKNGEIQGNIKFSSGKGNYSVTSKLAEQQKVSENGDFDMSQFAPIWLNEEYDFEYPLTLSEYKLLKQKTKKTVKFTDNNGTEFFGYIQEVEIDLKAPGKSLSKFKMLRAK